MVKGNLIGEGRTAEVYEWGDGRVLKLYRDWCPPDWSRHEAELGRALHATGLPAPAVLEVVEVEGRQGIVYERVAGRSLREQITAAPWRTGRAGRRLARLHRDIQARPAPRSLPTLRGKIAHTVEASRKFLAGDADRVLRALAVLPEGLAVCHYDFHPENVLGEGPGLRVIDWGNACVGNPAGDAARTLVILRSPYMGPGVSAPLRAVVMGLKRWLASAYQAEYLRLSGLSQAALAAWLVPVAAARLWEEIPGEREWLLEVVRQGLG